jgi:hypothetical protein
MARLGCEYPVPFRVAIAGVEPAVASATVRVAPLVPTAAGLKTTWIAQVVRGAKGTTHLLSVIAKSVSLVPPSAGLRMPNVEPPILATLNVMAALVKPTLAENEPRFGVMAKLAGVTTVGVTGTVFTTPAEPHTMLSTLSPGVLALNVKAYTQGVFAAMVAAQVVFAGSGVRSAPLGRHSRSVTTPVAVTVTETGTL